MPHSIRKVLLCLCYKACLLVLIGCSANEYIYYLLITTYYSFFIAGISLSYFFIFNITMLTYRLRLDIGLLNAYIKWCNE